jgi:hypothetical protein
MLGRYGVRGTLPGLKHTRQENSSLISPRFCLGVFSCSSSLPLVHTTATAVRVHISCFGFQSNVCHSRSPTNLSRPCPSLREARPSPIRQTTPYTSHDRNGCGSGPPPREHASSKSSSYGPLYRCLSSKSASTATPTTPTTTTAKTTPTPTAGATSPSGSD